MFSLTELGKRLKEAREEKKLTLDDLQNVTKIQKRYLIGIEQGKYELIPGKFYVRAFIKQYAEAVGLNPDQLFDEYRHDIPSVYEEDLPEQLTRSQSRKMVSKGPSKFLELLPKLVLALFVIGAVFALWYFIQKAIGNEKATVDESNDPSIVEVEDTKPDEEENPTEADNGEKDVEEEDPVEETPIEEEPVKEPELVFVETNGTETTFELRDAEDFQFQIGPTPGNETWVRVIDANNQQLFSGTLSGESKQSFDLSGQTSVWFRIGNITGTEVFINDLQFEIPADVLNAKSPHNFTIRFVDSEASQE